MELNWKVKSWLIQIIILLQGFQLKIEYYNMKTLITILIPYLYNRMRIILDLNNE